MKLKAVEQGTSIYVLGTHAIRDAAAALPTDVTRWNLAECGRYAARKRGFSYYDDERAPKDARIGVRFGGVVRRAEGPLAGEITHAVPAAGSALPCCGLTPFDLPRTDRMTLDSAEVTCTPAPRGDDS